jgi:DNA processing protein
MSSLATQRDMNDLQVAYSYGLSHLAHLSEGSARKLKKLFPTYQSWLQLTSAERQEATKALLGSDAPSFVNTNFEALMDRAMADVKDHERQGIRVISIDSSEFPELLKQIQDPPMVLFVKGAINAVSGNSNVAVIGTRDSTTTGEKVAFKIAKWLGEHRWCVVSGLAKGIDAAAHRGALDTQFCTAAVMATPLNKIYPVENKQLAVDILDHGGCWISELPLWKKPHRSSFVQRDRIQSGISVAVVPVQTDVEGGTMHTVRYAEQQGRLVLCPRPIRGEQFMRQYAGIRNLIETQRARPFSGDEYNHILKYLTDRREELLKIPRQQSSDQLPELPVPSLAEMPIQEKTAEPEPKAANQPKRKRRGRLQVGFDFIEEPLAGGRHNTRGQKERESHIRLLEQLRDEILSAKRPDGANVSNAQDLQEWLEEKIRILRRGA